MSESSWKQFFLDNKSVTNDSADQMDIEDLYQAFKARLMAEVAIAVPHEASEDVGRLVHK